MKRLGTVLLLIGGLAVAQTQVPYKEVAVAAAALARLQTVAAQAPQGEAKILSWAQEVKAKAERSFEAKAYFQAAREAQAALFLYQAAKGPEGGSRRGLKGREAPVARAFHPRFRPGRGPAWVDWVDRAEKELAYYRVGDALVQALIEEAKARKEKEPLRARLLAWAALALISADRGF